MQTDPQVAKLQQSFNRGLRPETILPLDVWADQYLVSPIFKGGRFLSAMTPYCREPMRCLSINDPTQKVVLNMATQLVKTAIGTAWLAYIVYYAAGPFMHVRTKLAAAREFADERIKPIWQLPALAGKVAKAGGRDKAGRKLYTEYEGGFFYGCGSHSADDLAAKTVPYAWQDEVDREAPSAKSKRGDEGPAHLLIEKRLSTAGSKRKLLFTSSPTTEDGPIYTMWQDGSAGEYHVPCPHCGELQVLTWEHVRWDGDPRGPKSEFDCWYECAACHERIDEWQKSVMFAEENGARWIHAHPERPDRSFRLPTLYAAVGGRDWKDMAKSYCLAVDALKLGDSEPMKVFKQTDLAECYEYVGESEVPTNVLMGRREIWPEDAIPSGVLVVTCGADVQDDRIEAQVMGWGVRGEKWSLDYGVWSALEDREGLTDFDHFTDFWHRQYRTADGRYLPISQTTIDLAGHRTDEVYDYCRKFNARDIIAIKGANKIDYPTVDRASKKHDKHSVRYRIVGVNSAKHALLPSLKFVKPEAGEGSDVVAPGYWHFPIRDWCDEEFFAQVTAEHMVRPKGAFDTDHIGWQKHRPRNEGLDTAIYAYVALRILEIERRLKGIIERNNKRISPLPSMSQAKSMQKPLQHRPVSAQTMAPIGPGPVRSPVGGRYVPADYPRRY